MMKLIVGLGNTGIKYERTRHNLGFMVIEQFLKDYKSVEETVWINEPKFKSDIQKIEWGESSSSLDRAILAKPKTFMNNSGLAVRLLSDYYKIKPADIWIIHDDVDLPFGTLKIKFGGAAAGHHGVESVIDGLKTDNFWRFRMGIGKPDKELDLKKVEDYVLEEFGTGELGELQRIVKNGSDAIQTALDEGMEKAMNKFNTK